MSRVEKAVACFKEGFHCSQAVFSTYSAQFGLDRETALKVSEAFGGGMARMGETCGAVTGAFMVIGLKHSSAKAGDKEAVQKVNDLVREFVDEFKSRNGTIICKKLLECDISTPEGMKTFQEKKLRSTLCPKFIQDAAEILEQIL